MILSIEDLRFSYPGNPVLEGITLSLQQGEVLALLGPNGTGKTTLLKCINRILKPAQGCVLIENTPVSQLDRRSLAQQLGYVEQQRSGSRMTVLNAVLLGRKPYIKWDIRQSDIQIAVQSLEKMGLAGFETRHLDTLSGGELQKVIIARALAQQPKVFLMDEPTSSLDLRNQLEVLTLIKTITTQDRIAAIIAIHDINLALRFADRFAMIKDGKVVAAGGHEIITPAVIESVYTVPVAVMRHGDTPYVIPL